MTDRLKNFWKGLSPAARLSTAYMMILLVICIVFSVALYHLAEGQLRQSLRHQYFREHQPPPSIGGHPPEIDSVRTELDTSRTALILRLIYFDLGILALGSFASYALAKRTVRPIEEALASQTRFTADASHELRTPLTAMQTEIEVALRDPKIAKAEAVSLLHSNLEEVVKLRQLADGLLSLASNGGKTMKMESTSVGVIVEGAVQRCQKAATDKKITVEADVGEMAVTGNTHSLIELVTILLDNAIRYSPALTKVQISAAERSGSVILKVSDQGRGIAEADLPRIFERFYRADKSRSNTDVEGYGLGLSIAQKIVEIHHGQITAQSQPGAGAVFEVHLPKARA